MTAGWTSDMDAALVEAGYATVTVKSDRMIGVQSGTDPRAVHRAAVLRDGDKVGDLVEWMRWQIEECESRCEFVEADLLRRWFRDHGLLTDAFNTDSSVPL